MYIFLWRTNRPDTNCTFIEGKAMNKFIHTALRVIGAIILVLALGPILISSPVRAAAPPPYNLTLTVNSAADIVAAAPLDDDQCATAYLNGVPNGVCTLRAAIMKANHSHAAAVTIRLPGLPPGGRYVLTIPPAAVDDEASGDLNINSRVSILGDGERKSIIDGNGLATGDRVLTVGLGAVVYLADLSIENGVTPDFGGGIEDLGTLDLSQVAVTGNRALHGGGIWDRGSLTLETSTIADNTAGTFSTSQGGGVMASSATLVVQDSLIKANTIDSAGADGSYGGAGINCLSSTCTITDSSISNNTVTAGADSGGGLVNDGSTVTITGSTISANTSSLKGGGIFSVNTSTTTIINSTISDNIAAADGGGIATNGSTVSLFNTTVAFNKIPDGFSGGGINNLSGTVTLANSILDENYHTIPMPPGSVIDDCSGSLTSQRFNLISTTSGCTLVGSLNDKTHAIAHLGPLHDNGGPTQTEALLPGSPAIDAGNPAGCTDNVGATLIVDQRGYLRPVGLRCDIGAFEYQFRTMLPLLFH
jgi:hypothetical protein